MSLKVTSLINALVIRKKTKNKGTTVSNTKDGITYGETNPANGVNGLKNLCAQKEIVILHLIYGIYVVLIEREKRLSLFKFFLAILKNIISR